MDYRDTVMWAKNPQIMSDIAEAQNKLLLKQAEISFKMGIEEAFSRYKESPEYKLDLMKAKRCGIEKVVELLGLMLSYL